MLTAASGTVPAKLDETEEIRGVCCLTAWNSQFVGKRAAF
jgi:hypothetical protein